MEQAFEESIRNAEADVESEEQREERQRRERDQLIFDEMQRNLLAT